MNELEHEVSWANFAQAVGDLSQLAISKVRLNGRCHNW